MNKKGHYFPYGYAAILLGWKPSGDFFSPNENKMKSLYEKFVSINRITD